MKRLCGVLGIFVGLVSAIAVAQSPDQQGRPTFTGRVDLVTIDVTVLDRDSRPVPGLTAEDFEIKLDGKVQPVRVVSFLEIGPAELAEPVEPSPTDPAPERPVFTNERLPQPEPRVFVFLFDDLSMAPTRGRPLLLASQRFVRGLPARDYVGFVTSSGSRIVNPTLDHAAVADALAQAVGGATDVMSFRPGQAAGGQDGGTPDSPVGVSQALAIDRGDLDMLRQVIANECFGGDRQQVDTQNIGALAAENNCVAEVQRQARQTATFAKAVVAQQASVYTSVIDSMSGAPGFKQLVVLTEGLAVDAEIDPLKPVARAAARSGVRISVMVEEADLNLGDEGRREMDGTAATTRPLDSGLAQRRREDGRLLLNGAATATEMAGGQLYRIIGDPDPFFDRVTRAGSAVYRLGVQALPNTTVGQEFTVEAKVKNHGGVSVAANRIAIVPEPEAPAAPKEVAPPTVDERLGSAIRSGDAHFGVPIEIGTLVRRAQGAAASPGAMALEVAVDVEITAPVTGPLVAMYGLIDSAGQLTSGRRELPAPAEGRPVTVSFVLPVKSGDYKLRFAAADPAGNMGSIEVPLAASLTTIGPFISSDILAAWVDGRGQAHLLILEALPAGTTSLRASLELYPAGTTVPAGDVTVAWTLTKVGETFAEDEREVIAQPAGDVRRAGVEFATDMLQPGAYTVRATIRSGDQTLGTLVKTIQVKPGVI